MKYKILTAILATGGLGYLLYNKLKKQPKEVISIRRLDDNDYVIYFDEEEVDFNPHEEKFV